MNAEEDDRPPSIRGAFFRFVFKFSAFVLALALIAGLLVLHHYDRRAARYDLAAVGRLPRETVVLGADGTRIGHLHAENVTQPVSLAEISPHFLDALVAREDSRFRRHRGVDHIGLVRAWLRNLKEKRFAQGASTLTMQLARMTYGLREKSYERKLVETALARRIEKRYSKDEILHQYANRIFLGTGMNGIGQAARGYFGKSADELTLSESAMIAGIIRAPNGFSPFRHPEAALREMRGTLDRMVEEGMITGEEADAAKASPPAVLPQQRWMERLREQSKVSPGSWELDLVERRIHELFPSHTGTGGLTVHTTFDTRVQRAAEEALEKGLRTVERTPGYRHPLREDYRGRERGGEGTTHGDGKSDPAYLQGAVAVVDNGSGALRALVGGRDHDHSSFNRAIQSNRQMGSVFKPLVYATAFEVGLFPGTLVDDSEIEPGEIEWDPTGWNPANSDGRHLGLLPAEAGLIQSRNTMSVRVGERAGLRRVLAMRELAGLGAADGTEPLPPVYLGSNGASPRDLASAYSIFATGGERWPTYLVERVLDRDGTVLHEHEAEPHRVVSPGATWMTANLLKRVVEEGGTASSLRSSGFPFPAAGKTGTTDDFHDAWFVGCTSRLTAAVWVGLDQPAPIAPGAFGGKIALPVWRDLMAEAADIGYEFTEFNRPGAVLPVKLCRRSALLANEHCEAEGHAYVEQVPEDMIPRDFCREH